MRLFGSLSVLVLAAYQDYRTQTVSNKLWMYAPFGFAFTLFEYGLFSPNLLVPAAVTITATCILSLALFFVFPSGWGGADTKALITLAASYPLAPIFLNSYAGVPLFALVIGCMVSLAAMRVKKVKALPLLPFVLFGFIVMVLI